MGRMRVPIYIYIIYAFFNNAEVTGDSKVNIGKKDEGE